MTGECDKEVYEHGKCIAAMGDVAGEIVEVWCKLVAKDSGQKVDWYYMGGRAVIKAVGDLKKVDEAAYWYWDSSIPERAAILKHLGGAVSWYGYHPGGHNHWSKE